MVESDDKKLEPAAWVKEYRDYLFRYANSRLRNSESSEEAVHETFIATLKHVDQYQGKGTERAWLLGILKRKIIDLIRERTRMLSLSDEGLRAAHSDNFFDQNGSWNQEI